jgi:hypothetical protein
VGRWSGMRVWTLFWTVIIALAMITVGADTQPVSAAAPPPPLTGCLARGAYLLSDFACYDVRPHTGNQFGPISGVTVRPVARGQDVHLSAPAPVDFTPVTGNCGENGCPQNTVHWRYQDRGDGITFVSGCGATDNDCTVSYAPSQVGDAGEVYMVVYGEGYHGINPTGNSVALALYTPPLIYPVRLDPVDTTGAAVDIPAGFLAYAIAPGADPTQAECLDKEWYWPHRFDPTIATPRCVTLSNRWLPGVGVAQFEGYLPNDSGTWTVVAGPGGDPGAPLLSRPAGYRRMTVTPASNDIETTVVAERQPTLDVAIIPESQTMDIGTTQQVEVVVSAVGGDAGALDGLTFRDAGILTVGAAAEPVIEVIDGAEVVPAGGFSVESGASRTFLLDIQAVGLGDGSLDTSVAGRDTLGNFVEGTAGGPISVESGTSTGAAIPAPVVTTAQDVTTADTDPIAGTVDGAAGSTVTVSLASSPVQDEDTCLQLMAGEGVTALGSVSVDIGDDGHGAFALEGPLVPGSYVYGIASDGGKVSRVGDCTAVTTVEDDDASATDDLDVRGTWTLTQIKASRGVSEAPLTFQVKSQDPDTGDIAGSLKTEYGPLKISGRISGSKLTLRTSVANVTTKMSGTLAHTGGKLTGVLSGTNNSGRRGSFRVVIVPREP